MTKTSTLSIVVMLSITGICYSLRANSLQLAKSRLRCRMGGALAIPIDPNCGYRRSAPPPTLQLSANKICSDASKSVSEVFFHASGRLQGVGWVERQRYPSIRAVGTLISFNGIHVFTPGSDGYRKAPPILRDSDCVGWVEAVPIPTGFSFEWPHESAQLHRCAISTDRR